MSALFDQYQLLLSSKLFDAEYYLKANEDVAEAGLDPLIHYLEEGAREGRRPSELFDVGYYIKQCSTRGETVDNPLIHYLRKGKALGLETAAPTGGSSATSTAPAAVATTPGSNRLAPSRLSRLLPATAAKSPAAPASALVHPKLSSREISIALSTVTLSGDGVLTLDGVIDTSSPIIDMQVFLNDEEIGRPNLLTEPTPPQKHVPGGTQTRFSLRAAAAKYRQSSVRLTLFVKASNGVGRDVDLLLSLNAAADAGTANMVQAVEETNEIQLFVEKPDVKRLLEPLAIESGLTITGWAIASSGIEKIDLILGGRILTTTVPKISRGDVRAAHPNVKGSLRSGFELSVHRREFRSGLSEVEIRAYDGKGARKRISFPVSLPQASGQEKSGPPRSEYVSTLYGEVLFKLNKLAENATRHSRALEAGARSAPDLRKELGELVLATSQAAITLCEVVRALPAVPPEQGAEWRAPLEEVVRILLARPEYTPDLTPAPEHETGGQTHHAVDEQAVHHAFERNEDVAYSSPSDGQDRFSAIEFFDSFHPKLSVVVPVFNQFFYTHQCLKSLKQNAPHVEFEVIVADDASTDETVHAEGTIKGVRFLRNESNQGFLESCNRAVATARGEYVLLLNNDTELKPGAIDALLATFDRPSVGLVGAKLIYPDGTLQEAGGIIWNDGTTSNYGRQGDAQDPSYNYRRQVDYCSAAALMVRKSVWDELGGFDSRFRPAYYEDVDLAFRARKAGYEVCYQPLAEVIHFEGITSGKELDHGAKSYQETNAQRFREAWARELSTYPAPGADLLRVRDQACTMRALFLDATTPTPDQDAGSFVALQHMKILQSLGYKVTFVPSDNFSYVERYTQELQSLGIEVIYGSGYGSLDDLLGRSRQEFELAYVHRYTVGEEAIPLIRKYSPRTKILFNNADLHYLRMMREVKLNPSQEKMAEARRVKQVELAVIKSADLTVLCNTTEQKLLLQEAPESRFYYLPWVVEACERPPENFNHRSGFMFLGGFGHSPNVDAVNYFVRDVMPKVRPLLPGVCFYIYGSKIPDEIRAMECEDIRVQGHIPDLSTAFSSHRVSVVPLRYGAGFKGKLASSLSYGVPAVATSMAIEGSGLVPDQHVLVADDAAGFAKRLAQLYSGEELWRKTSQAGWRYVADHFSYDRATAHFKNMLQLLR